MLLWIFWFVILFVLWTSGLWIDLHIMRADLRINLIHDSKLKKCPDWISRSSCSSSLTTTKFRSLNIFALHFINLDLKNDERLQFFTLFLGYCCTVYTSYEVQHWYLAFIFERFEQICLTQFVIYLIFSSVYKLSAYKLYGSFEGWKI